MMYTVDVQVTDTSYSTVNGVDQQSPPTTRTIKAAVDKNGQRRLEQIFGGSVSAGTVGIYTTGDTLYFIDQNQSGRETHQSYVLDNNYLYKVIDESDWLAQVGIKVYLAERHTTQEQI